MSFLEFSQALIKSKTLINEIYEPVFDKRVYSKYDQIKEIAADNSSASVKE